MGLNFFLAVKALHIIGVVCWFAGLFYLVRLFIYHVEAFQKPPLEGQILCEQFAIMEERLWMIITVPSAYLTSFTGLYLLWYLGNIKGGWLHAKLFFVFLLLLYHLTCGFVLGRLKKGSPVATSFQLRLWNEVATVLLFAIVYLVIFKNGLNALYGVLFLLFLSIGLSIITHGYKKIRGA